MPLQLCRELEIALFLTITAAPDGFRASLDWNIRQASRKLGVRESESGSQLRAIIPEARSYSLTIGLLSGRVKPRQALKLLEMQHFYPAAINLEKPLPGTVERKVIAV